MKQGLHFGKMKEVAGVAENQLLHRLFFTSSPCVAIFCKSLIISNNVPRTCALAFQNEVSHTKLRFVLNIWIEVLYSLWLFEILQYFDRSDLNIVSARIFSFDHSNESWMAFIRCFKNINRTGTYCACGIRTVTISNTNFHFQSPSDYCWLIRNAGIMKHP